MNELFSGIGAQIEGIEMTGLFDCEVKCTSDISKEAIVSYAAIHCGLTKELINTYENYPTREEMAKYLADKNIGYDFKKNKPYNWNKLINRKSKDLEKYYLACVLSNNVGDISKIDKLEYADFWTYSFPCFVEGTLVLTDNGYKAIEEITVDDFVMTHKNNFKKVVKPMINQADKLIKVDTMISESLLTTEKHPFYTRNRYKKWNSEKGVNERIFSEPKWIEASELNRDCYVGTPINQNSSLPNWSGITFKWSDGRQDRHKNVLSDSFNKNDFWYLIGRYIGDGWIRTGGGIIICSNPNETGQITQKIESCGFNYNITCEGAVNKIHISFKEIGEYCEQFGRGAANKHLTSDILNLPIDKLKSFLDGYIDSDGSYTQGLFKISSVSRNLIYDIGQCVAKAYNRPFSVYFTQRPKTCTIEGRIVNQKDSYQITFKTETNTQDKAFYEDGYIWSPVNDIHIIDYNGLVYNLEVEDDNSYVVQNIIVHNCTDISVAGKQEGIKKGETRSGLIYEVERLLKISVQNNESPKYLLLENVKNLVGKQFKEQFDEWISTLNELGYNTYFKVVNAKNCGIPQNRERVFAVSIRKNIDTEKYEFMKDFDNGLRLRDLLENEVDEKYYLSEEIQNRLQITDNTFTKNIVGTTAPDFRTIGQRDLVYQEDSIMGALVATDYKQPKQILETNRCLQVADLNHYGFEDMNRVYSNDGVSPTLRTMKGGNRQPKILINEDQKFIDNISNEYSFAKSKCQEFYDKNGYLPEMFNPYNQAEITDIAPTQTTMCDRSCSSATVLIKKNNKRVRKLTPKECWRLMGFNDKCIEKAKSLGMSDSAGYEQAGNSIVTYCIKGLMEHLYKAQYDNTYECFDENFTLPQVD